MPSRVHHTPGPGYSEPLSCLEEEEVEVAYQAREAAVVGRHPSLAGVAEVVGEAYPGRRAVVAVAAAAAAAFQAREEVVGVHQTLQVVAEVGVEVGTG